MLAIGLILCVLVAGYVFYRANVTNTTHEPYDDYTSDDTWNGETQTVHYIQPRKGEVI